MATDFEALIKRIEPKWQDYWLKNKTFKTPDPGEPGSEKPKYYCLDMFPYPSGDGLHVGHLEGYTATDIISRYKRMRGFNVLHPMGWDAFGLPAEQYALKHGVHPAITTQKNVDNFRRQIRQTGFSYDWDREINTTDPNYFKWTQWIFSKIFEKGLAYESEMPVNWCPALGTVLANEEVIDGKSERGGHPVERRPMRQWVLKITAYAERLLQDLELCEWPEATKEMQKNWIGKSQGAYVKFEDIEVFTTRPDTLMGVTFLVLAPEHALVKKFTTPAQASAVEAYVKAASLKNDLQRTDLAKDKSGVFTGSTVKHPITGQAIPVWVADYVLVSYGTGAVMGVAAHDERDQEFAKKFELPIIPVVDEENNMFLDASNSPALQLGGKSLKEGTELILKNLEASKSARRATIYKLRDWNFSRQRYWGEPFPILHFEASDNAPKETKLVPFEQLPVTLPEVEKYQPTGTGESPLASVKHWLEVTDPVTGRKAKRETNTMPQWAGSCWYYLRYMDANNKKEAWSKEKEKYWGQVDLYVGGAEHAVLHLLYSRFWHKVLFDCGLVSHPEPFKKLVHQGLILGEDGEKMSKSRGNVVNPDTVIAEYGADTVRLYEMFLGPLEKAKPWSMNGIEGVYRFLSRFFRLAVGEQFSVENPTLAAHIKDIPENEWTPELVREYHKCIKTVGEDIEALRLNTAISAMMVLTNECYAFLQTKKVLPRKVLSDLTLLLAPFAPHMCEEVWSLLGNSKTLAYQPWPNFDEAKIQVDEIEIPIQVNGKIRDKVMVNKDISEDELKKLALSREQVIKWLEGAAPKKVIYVKGKLLSVVK